jgi:usherin
MGSLDQNCNPATGQCNCKLYVTGQQCSTCASGYWNFASGCPVCACDSFGSVAGTVCDPVSGQCKCKPYTTGRTCSQCADGYYNFGSDVNMGCTSCGCNAAGSNDKLGYCDKTTGACVCKANVIGRTCNSCAATFYNLTQSNPVGCQPCNCDVTGTQLGNILPSANLTCNQNTGQCNCLSSRSGLRCDSCVTGSLQIFCVNFTYVYFVSICKERVMCCMQLQ